VVPIYVHWVHISRSYARTSIRITGDLRIIVTSGDSSVAVSIAVARGYV